MPRASRVLSSASRATPMGSMSSTSISVKRRACSSTIFTIAGHKEIVLISPNEHVISRGGAYVWRFRDAALERAARYGLRIHPYYGETQQPAITESLHRILDERPTATALIVHNDATIAGLPSVLNARGVEVPRDLSVVGIFSEDFGRLFSLPYTAIETSPDKLGRAAVQALVQRMRDGEGTAAPVVRFIAPELTDRGSTR